MRGSEYKKYLESADWAHLRERSLIRAGNRCQLCNSRHRLNVHHRTYERVGRELLEDLTVLCRDCHTTFHAALAVAGVVDPVECEYLVTVAIDTADDRESAFQDVRALLNRIRRAEQGDEMCAKCGAESRWPS